MRNRSSSDYHTFTPILFSSTIATLLGQPVRVLYNQAAIYNSPIETLKRGMPLYAVGVRLNLLRGISSTSVQAYVKEKTQKRAGLIPGLFASSFTGAGIASLIETPYIRKTLYAQREIVFKSMVFSRSLAGLYFLRDFGFTVGVLAKNDMPNYMQDVSLLASTWVSASFHKLAAIEASKDLLPKNIIVPNYRAGLVNVAKQLAQGDSYTHPALKVPFPKPNNILRLSANFLHASCGPNVFLFRFLYMFLFREAYTASLSAYDKLAQMSIFSNKINPDVASAHQPPVKLVKKKH